MLKCVNSQTKKGTFMEEIFEKRKDLFEEKIKKAEEFTGYKFKNECLCVQAFVRKSFKYENTTYLIDNERLEFIGDSVLNAAITKRFAERYKFFGKIYGCFVAVFFNTIYYMTLSYAFIVVVIL